jgi:DNA-binding transcriptional LysR family regulator
MDLNRAELFVRVVESGSFTAAAKLANLPKSSVSRGVAALEQELGVRLLQRTTRKLSLTDAGRVYFDTAAQAINGLREAESALSRLQDEPRGTVRITASLDVGVMLLAPVVARFVGKYPAVRIDTMLTPRNVDFVQEGIDLALRAGRLADNTLVARPVGLLRAGLFAAPQYLKRHGSPKSVAELRGHQCMTFRAGAGVSEWELIGPVGIERVEVEGTINADGFEFLHEMVVRGLGIGLLPLYACPKLKGRASLVRILPDYATTGAPLHVVYPSARFLPKRVTLLRDMLLEALPSLLTDNAAAV